MHVNLKCCFTSHSVFKSCRDGKFTGKNCRRSHLNELYTRHSCARCALSLYIVSVSLFFSLLLPIIIMSIFSLLLLLVSITGLAFVYPPSLILSFLLCEIFAYGAQTRFSQSRLEFRAVGRTKRLWQCKNEGITHQCENTVNIFFIAVSFARITLQTESLRIW